MDGDFPIRISQEGDHQVVHLPAGVTIPDGATGRQEAGRVVLELKKPKPGSLAELLKQMAEEGPLAPEDQMPPIERGPPRPFEL